MAKDWITGRSWNTGGGGGSPFAMAAIGLLQALQNNRREDERKEEMERMMQEKKAMQEIQTGRTLMERIAQMDPALWGDQGFVDAWKAGDTTYPAKIGWKPQQAAEVVEEPDYEKTFKQNAYKKLQAGEELTEQEKIALKLAAMPSTGYGTASEGAVIYNRSTGQPTMKNQKTFRPSGGGGGGGGKPVDANAPKTHKDIEEDGYTVRVYFNANGDVVKRTRIGKAKPNGNPDQVEVELAKIPPAPKSVLSKIGAGIKNIFKDDDEEELAAFRKALQ